MSAEDSSPAAKLAVTRVWVKPDQVEAFITAESKIKQALASAGYQGRIRWYQLVSGGETTQFLMLADLANWAAYDQSLEDQLHGILERRYGVLTAGILQDIDVAVRSKYVETWQYRADLGFQAAAN